MKPIKIIPCLDVKDGRVVKEIKFTDMADARDPAEAAFVYSKQGADELAFLDITATIENSSIHTDWVKKIISKTSLPLIAGGGIRNLQDIENLFTLGVSNVALNTITPQNQEFIRKAVARFGSERIIVAIDGIKNPPGNGHPRLETVMPNGDDTHNLELVDWAKQVEALGAGAILLTSKDTDGTKDGFDMEMIRAVTRAVSIPVIASGGAGKLEDMYAAIIEGKAQAVLAASVFHSGIINISELKTYLHSKGIPVNIPHKKYTSPSKSK
ncbi:MAG: imidazole glycerol phosphate synthase subunit HisF [Dehalococcoides mccartyi]|uniref:imidazole glycerol phosphate synthase subunit HisF n=1 Tax=Dehalococcoides mccartyi TaxID=61435 RepID=UPI000805E550|nr:imidazole glycerol phosphate synthase cyclase subunit [Dehalococcoides mccartyi]OBW63437.1 MAG: imidazole glycerol phosphate synthase subunit HisF [Dehalococcoides mccartyi]